MLYRVIWAAWIGLWLNFAGCASSKGHDPIDLNDSMVCDQATQDCVPVTIGFIMERAAVEADLAKYKQALKACQEQHR